MSFKLENLPYKMDALAPFMSQETLEFHYGKHHQAYVDNLNKLLSTSSLKDCSSLEEIIVKSKKDASLMGIFNNAAQDYNHNEFWKSMKKNSSDSMPSIVKQKLVEAFGSVDAFKAEIVQKGTEVFGSGWVWLQVNKDNKLEIAKFSNADNPLANGNKEILGCDVWEHSYYIDYRNKRADYLKSWIENLINWEYVEEKMKKSL
jgi:Fe-Mn family superoxide dismutase